MYTFLTMEIIFCVASSSCFKVSANKSTFLEIMVCFVQDYKIQPAKNKTGHAQLVSI